ncbi:MAG: DMT family transporter [Bacteroidota bacterium]|nr:DMT family transporter [Bacteroidota bacterium]
MTTRTKAHLGLLATNLFFAINISAVKYFTTNKIAGPYGLNVIRLGVSVILFWFLFIISINKRKIDKKDIGRFLLCALLALALNQMLFMKGLSYTYSIHVSLLLLITPILITFIAAWVLKERLNNFKIIGLFLGISGAVILISSRENAGKGNNIFLGDMLTILSAVCYTFYFILVKPLMKKYSSIDVMRWIFTFGFFMILPIGWKEFTAINLLHFQPAEFILLFMIVVPGTFLAYIFNVYGIKVLGASVAGAYIYLQPVFAVIAAMVFLREELSMYKIIAAALIFSGVFLANKKGRI